MITRDELRRRCVGASAKTIAFARECILESLPDRLRFNLWLIPDWDGDEPRFAPQLASFWERSRRGKMDGLSIDEFISEIWHDGSAPEWIDLAVIDADDDSTFIEVRFSRKLVPRFSPSGPFNIRGPYIPSRLSTRYPDVWPIPEKWSLHEPR